MSRLYQRPELDLKALNIFWLSSFMLHQTDHSLRTCADVVDSASFQFVSFDTS